MLSFSLQYYLYCIITYEIEDSSSCLIYLPSMVIRPSDLLPRVKLPALGRELIDFQPFFGKDFFLRHPHPVVCLPNVFGQTLRCLETKLRLNQPIQMVRLKPLLTGKPRINCENLNKFCKQLVERFLFLLRLVGTTQHYR